MTNHSLIAFDLDDTLAPSKTAIDPVIAELLLALLERGEVCIISGGHYPQFQAQVLPYFGEATPETLARLHLMPTCGTQYYRHGEGEWVQVYAQNLTQDEKARAMAVVEQKARELGLWEEQTWGPILEDRGSQITFSALGQEAPVDAKHAWDPSGSKKEMLRDAVQAELGDLEVRSGGSTSVDITRRGIDKSYGMTRLAELTGVPLSDRIFVGDRLDEGGNDYPVKAMGVECIAVEGWEDTARLLQGWVDAWAAEATPPLKSSVSDGITA